MGISGSSYYPNKIEMNSFENQPSNSKNKRIFGSDSKSRQIANNLPFSLIESFQQNHASRPSQSIINLFSSRMVNTKNLVQLQFSFFNSLLLPAFKYQQNESIDLNGVQTKEDFYYNGMIYNGQILKGKPHGKGVIISKYQKYEGWFKNGMKNYYGRQIKTNQVYEGQFTEGRKKGKGTLFTKQKVEKGLFNEIFIKGTIQYQDGRIFQGEMDTSGKKTNKGIQKWKDGSSYEGDFLNDNFHGQGNMNYSDGSCYKGKFSNGLRNGYGVYVFPGKTDKKYEGQYWNNEKHGKGTLWTSIKNNYYFEGYFKNGVPNGQGKLRNQFGQRKVKYDHGVLLIE